MSVLSSPPPRFSAAEVEQIAAERLGVTGGARDLGSERDQTFLVEDGGAAAIVKISNLGEDPAVLDLEAAAILHIARVDPSLPVARPVAIDGELRATVEGPDGTHFLRRFERLQGRNARGHELDDAALAAYGETHARLNRALRSFFHPAAGRDLLWDLRQTPQLRSYAPAIEDATRRAIVERVLDRFDAHVAPRWERLRAHVVHGDLNLDNVLVDERGLVTGIVDFGDVVWSAEVADFAVGLASLLRGRSGDDVFRSARLVIDGFTRHSPLEDDERAVLADLVAARLAAIVTISAWRSERYPENTEYIQAHDADSWALLERFDALGAEAVARELGALQEPAGWEALRERRFRSLGRALSLTYETPVHVVRSEGVWLYGPDGERYLDAYNNVPVVGHSHPRVTEAVVRQTRLLNTHSRYLSEPLVELAERLTEAMPAGSGLDTVLLVNSGSEANDLAWRIATTVTENGGAICTRFAYHGVSTAIAAVSPEEWPPGYAPAHVARVDPFGDLDAELVRAVTELGGHELRLAATYIDGGFTSDGILQPGDEAMAAMVARTHEAGGLYIADEVQIGYGRTGEALWSFERDGITPDLVTLGKPMGNGYPVAAVITRREIAEQFWATNHFFSTFGGNPVAASAALAVLDVIRDERVVERVGRVGTYLAGALSELGEIAAVRASGLMIGVELRSTERAAQLVEGLRKRRVLIGRTGLHENVLKIRPPLAFTEEHCDLLLGHLRAL
ncbi:MAG: aminotransferase class III-fold pyridoxal phosphate-dependent enzyme [Actinobacteria bacterium]|nr:aminotransferase class III-fold pyridoxal phosphate-dependent enzyme [Actinomycetota bacterium]